MTTETEHTLWSQIFSVERSMLEKKKTTSEHTNNQIKKKFQWHYFLKRNLPQIFQVENKIKPAKYEGDLHHLNGAHSSLWVTANSSSFPPFSLTTPFWWSSASQACT